MRLIKGTKQRKDSQYQLLLIEFYCFIHRPIFDLSIWHVCECRRVVFVGLLLNREFTILPSSIPSLAIWLTGVIPIVDMQRAIEKTVSQAAHLQYSQPMLILCEHEKAITVGRSGSRQDIACSDEDLALQGIPLMFIGRKVVA